MLVPIDAFRRRRGRIDPAELAETIRQIDGCAFSYDSTPFLRLPTACLGDIGGTCRVVIQSPAQVGKTVAIENFLAWICEFDRQNVLLILDSDKTGRRMSKNRLRPFLRATCGINSKEGKLDNPDASKEITNIGLAPGANLIIGSSKSASDLCSTPVKYLLCDELDRWSDSLAREGDPLALAFQRQMRFPSSMALLTSTPTVEQGRIHQHYLLGTQEIWGVVCTCGQWLNVEWDAINFDGSEPFFVCKTCGACHNEKAVRLLKHAYSSPQNDKPYLDKCGRVARSFAITAPLCHSFYDWDYLKREELAARGLGEVSHQSFRNTRLGEVYIPPSEQVIYSSDLIHTSMCDYSPVRLPNDVSFLVAGVDTQDNGFAVEICGFSEDRQKVYGIEWCWIGGNPKSEPEIWNKLSTVLNTEYRREDGEPLRVIVSCQDSGGHCTQEVYGFSMRRRNHFAVKGVIGKNELVERFSKVNVKALGRGTGKCWLTLVGTICAKEMILAAIQSNLGGELRYFWPQNATYDVDYFKQLTAEKRVVEKNGAVRWVLIPGRHNEALDCRVYALVAAEIYVNKTCKTASIAKKAACDQQPKEEKRKVLQNEAAKIDTKEVKQEQKAVKMHKFNYKRSL